MQRGGAPAAVEKIEQASSAKIFSGTARRRGQMRRGYLWSASVRSTDLFFPIIEGKTIFVSSTAKRQRGLSRGNSSPLTRFCLLLAVQKEGPRRVGVLTKPCKRLRDADRRDEMIALIFAVNPSVSLVADSLSLRLGHGAALICHWHIRAAPPLRYPLHRGAFGLVWRVLLYHQKAAPEGGKRAVIADWPDTAPAGLPAGRRYPPGWRWGRRQGAPRACGCPRS